jgi:menaquinone-specific isochorismate synthase
MNLGHLKSDLLKEIIQKWSIPQSDQSEYHSLIIERPSFDLYQLLKSLKYDSTSYFKNKEDDLESIFIGVQASFSTHDEIQKMESLSLQNKELYFLGGFNFDFDKNGELEWADLRPGLFILPYLEIRKKSGVVRFIVHFPRTIYNDKNSQARWIDSLDENFKLEDDDTLNNQVDIKSIKLNPNKLSWAKIFRKGMQNIVDESFHKIVLARKKVFELKKPVNLGLVLNSLEGLNPNSYLIKFCLNKKAYFVSNTPERLIKIEGNEIVTEAIAGTRPMGGSDEENEDFINDLKSSYKEISEHRFVRKNLEDNLSEYSNSLQWEVEEEILQLKYIQHLYSRLRVQCSSRPNFFKIIRKLHPTPAVGGTPWKKAKSFLIKNESLNRGLYASPVGIYSKDYSDFSVAIRSALFTIDRVHIYAGAGIVKGSDEEGEWNEIENKMKNFENIISGGAK